MVLAALVSGWAPGAASAITSVQKFTMELSPSASPSPTGARPVALSFRASFDSIQGDLDQQVQFATVNATLFLPREATIASSYPSCAATTVFQDAKLCPGQSLVGTGTMTIKGLDLEEALTVQAFNSPGRALTLLMVGASPLVIREIVPVTIANPDADPQFGLRLAMAFPRNLQSPAPGVIAAPTDLSMSFPVPPPKSYPYFPQFFATTGCAGGAWPSKYVAEYTKTFDSAIESTQAVTTSQPCTPVTAAAPPEQQRQGRPTNLRIADLRGVQVFFTGQAALRGGRNAGRILSLNVAKVPDGAAVSVFCLRGCRLRRTRSWQDISDAGGEVTWRFARPLVVKRGARVVVSVSSGTRTAKITVGFRRRGTRLVTKVLRVR